MKHYLKAIASVFIGGLGQLFNRQYIKALLFFIISASFVSIELVTSHYGQPYDFFSNSSATELVNPQYAKQFTDFYTFYVTKGQLDDYPYFDQVIQEAKDENRDVTMVDIRHVIAHRLLEVEQVAEDDGVTVSYTDGSLVPYIEDDWFLSFISQVFHDVYTNPSPVFQEVTDDDYNRFLVEIYFDAHPEAKEYYLHGSGDPNDSFKGVSNFFYDQGGFFVKGYWGLITLGTHADIPILEHHALSSLTPAATYDINLRGHHSTRLMLTGIIAIILSLYFLFFIIWGIRDAYKTSKEIEATGKVPSQRKYFRDLYDRLFEYIFLFPAIFALSFVSVMPILFGLFVAFTNYNYLHIPPGQLIDWVGFDNFKSLFGIASGSAGIDFAGAFGKVFVWTLIFAIAATGTVFFGGFFQAIIINNSRVVFRKIWRGVLILPWAIPAIISQMVFRIFFDEYGVVNKFLETAGINQVLEKWGLIGVNFSELHGKVLLIFNRTLFYLGDKHVEWFTNPHNPWFVRFVVIVVNIWLGFPYFMALMTGVMTSISRQLYEAAEIDGASKWQQFRFITFPLVLYATAPLLIMTFAGNFNNFGVIYFMTGGGANGTASNAYAGDTDILISWIYKLTTDDTIRMYNMASVFSIIIFILIGSLSAYNFTKTRAFKEEDMI